jgi:hypothetical protein
MPDLINPTRMRRVAKPGETLVQEFFMNPGGGSLVASIAGDPIFTIKHLIGSRNGPREELTDDELSQLPPALREKLKREGFRPDVEFGRVGPGTPLPVGRGDRVKGEIECVIPTTQPEGTLFATLQLDGLGAPITVPFALTVGQVQIELLMRPVVARRGQSVDLPVRITFPEGTPAADITFELRGQHCRIHPQVVNVPEGGTVVGHLSLVADRDAPIATLSDQVLTTTGFDGPGLEDNLVFDIAIAEAGTQPGETEPGGTPTVPTMTGNWSGRSENTTVTLQLTQTGKSVSGTATLQGSPGSFPVNGTNNFPNVHLLGNVFGLPTTFSGAFSGANSVPGTLTIQGLPSVSVTLSRT